MSTRETLNKAGPATAKGKAILAEVEKNSTGWNLLTRDEKDDGSGASRQYQSVINGWICAHDIWTPKDKEGKWGKQENEFHMINEPDTKYEHVFDMYDYCMTLAKGSQAMKKTIDLADTSHLKVEK